MQHGLNKPLTRKQMKLLPSGFTPTSIGITGQQLKRAARVTHPSTSRKRTKGRDIQYVLLVSRDADGKVLFDEAGNKILTGRTRLVLHRPPRNSYTSSPNFIPWGLRP